MHKVLGIDTSNYTTSAAVIEDGRVAYDGRILLKVKQGERGLRQSEALFQHTNNLPELLKEADMKKIEAVAVSSRPRPITGSYMPVFLSGEKTAEVISACLGVPLYKVSHQEGHIEAAAFSSAFKENNFLGLHISGGTTELLKIVKSDNYSIEIAGGTRDISAGQFIDRIGVAMGYGFPAGKIIDDMAQKAEKRDLRIPSKADESWFNFSGQETAAIRLIDQGQNHSEVAFAVMYCIAKTLDKAIGAILKKERLPLLVFGGVASSSFLKSYFLDKYNNEVVFSDPVYSSDNAVGTAHIVYEKTVRC